MNGEKISIMEDRTTPTPIRTPLRDEVKMKREMKRESGERIGRMKRVRDEEWDR